MPDDMARRALAASAAVVYWDGKVPEDAPANQLEELYDGAEVGKAGGFFKTVESTYQSRWKEIVENIPATAKCLGGTGEADDGGAPGIVAAAMWGEHLKGLPCRICGSTEEEEKMVVCDKCEQCFHVECVKGKRGYVEPNDGPWYCQRCRTHIITNGHDDLVEALALLDFLFLGKEPEGAVEAERVARLRGNCRAHGKELQVHVRTKHFTQAWVNVPPVPMRAKILDDFHRDLGHVGRDKLVEAVKEWYWW